jgi:hypothetical protein
VGNGVHKHLRTRRILCPSVARHKLQPRGATNVLSVTRVTAHFFPARPLAAGRLGSRGHDFLGSNGGRRSGSRIDRKRRPAKRASHDRVNRDRDDQMKRKSKEAGSSPGYGNSPPLGHLLHLGMAQVPRGRLRFLALVNRLGEGRLGFSLDADQIISSLFKVCRLRSGRASPGRLRQIHDRGSLGPSSGSGGYVESYAPEGGS